MDRSEQRKLAQWFAQPPAQVLRDELGVLRKKAMERLRKERGSLAQVGYEQGYLDALDEIKRLEAAVADHSD